MNMITVQPMKKEDISMVVTLEENTFSTPWSYEALEESFLKDNYYFLVAKQENIVVGYVGMYVVLQEGDITNIAVAKEVQGQGIGTKLLKELLEVAKKHGTETINLEVRVSNESAISLYKKHGFEIIGRRKNFYTKPEEDGYLMQNSHI